MGLSMVSDHPMILGLLSDQGSLIRVCSNYENNQALVSGLGWDRAIIVRYWCCALVQKSSVGVCVVDIPLGDQYTFGEA